MNVGSSGIAREPLTSTALSELSISAVPRAHTAAAAADDTELRRARRSRAAAGLRLLVIGESYALTRDLCLGAPLRFGAEVPARCSLYATRPHSPRRVSRSDRVQRITIKSCENKKKSLVKSEAQANGGPAGRLLDQVSCARPPAVQSCTTSPVVRLDVAPSGHSGDDRTKSPPPSSFTFRARARARWSHGHTLSGRGSRSASAGLHSGRSPLDRRRRPIRGRRERRRARCLDPARAGSRSSEHDSSGFGRGRRLRAGLADDPSS